MKDIVILGTSGFAREILWLLEENNEMCREWNILGFVDEDTSRSEVDGYPVLGNDDWLMEYPLPIYAVIGIGGVELRRRVAHKYMSEGHHISFPSIVSGKAQLSKRVSMGIGCIITTSNILTTNITLGNFVTINLDCTVGHDTVIHDFVTINPGTHISGNILIGEGTEIGTGVSVIQGIHIGGRSVIGAGSVIIRDIPPGCTVVGNPGRIIRSENSG